MATTVSTEDLNARCTKYISSSEYAKNYDSPLYKECCLANNYCVFWKEAWFIWTVVGVCSFISICIAICIAWCCCCRDSGRSRGRGDDHDDVENIEEEGEEK